MAQVLRAGPCAFFLSFMVSDAFSGFESALRTTIGIYSFLTRGQSPALTGALQSPRSEAAEPRSHGGQKAQPRPSGRQTAFLARRKRWSGVWSVAMTTRRRTWPRSHLRPTRAACVCGGGGGGRVHSHLNQGRAKTPRLNHPPQVLARGRDESRWPLASCLQGKRAPGDVWGRARASAGGSALGSGVLSPG